MPMEDILFDSVSIKQKNYDKYDILIASEYDLEIEMGLTHVYAALEDLHKLLAVYNIYNNKNFNPTDASVLHLIDDSDINTILTSDKTMISIESFSSTFNKVVESIKNVLRKLLSLFMLIFEDYTRRNLYLAHQLEYYRRTKLSKLGLIDAGKFSQTTIVGYERFDFINGYLANMRRLETLINQINIYDMRVNNKDNLFDKFNTVLGVFGYNINTDTGSIFNTGSSIYNKKQGTIGALKWTPAAVDEAERAVYATLMKSVNLQRKLPTITHEIKKMINNANELLDDTSFSDISRQQKLDYIKAQTIGLKFYKNIVSTTFKNITGNAATQIIRLCKAM